MFSKALVEDIERRLDLIPADGLFKEDLIKFYNENAIFPKESCECTIDNSVKMHYSYDDIKTGLIRPVITNHIQHFILNMNMKLFHGTAIHRDHPERKLFENKFIYVINEAKKLLKEMIEVLINSRFKSSDNYIFIIHSLTQLILQILNTEKDFFNKYIILKEKRSLATCSNIDNIIMNLVSENSELIAIVDKKDAEENNLFFSLYSGLIDSIDRVMNYYINEDLTITKNKISNFMTHLSVDDALRFTDINHIRKVYDNSTKYYALGYTVTDFLHHLLNKETIEDFKEFLCDYLVKKEIDIANYHTRICYNTRFKPIKDIIESAIREYKGFTGYFTEREINCNYEKDGSVDLFAPRNSAFDLNLVALLKNTEHGIFIDRIILADDQNIITLATDANDYSIKTYLFDVKSNIFVTTMNDINMIGEVENISIQKGCENTNDSLIPTSDIEIVPLLNISNIQPIPLLRYNLTNSIFERNDDVLLDRTTLKHSKINDPNFETTTGTLGGSTNVIDDSKKVEEDISAPTEDMRKYFGYPRAEKTAVGGVFDLSKQSLSNPAFGVDENGQFRNLKEENLRHQSIMETNYNLHLEQGEKLVLLANMNEDKDIRFENVIPFTGVNNLFRIDNVTHYGIVNSLSLIVSTEDNQFVRTIIHWRPAQYLYIHGYMDSFTVMFPADGSDPQIFDLCNFANLPVIPWDDEDKYEIREYHLDNNSTISTDIQLLHNNIDQSKLYSTGNLARLESVLIGYILDGLKTTGAKINYFKSAELFVPYFDKEHKQKKVNLKVDFDEYIGKRIFILYQQCAKTKLWQAKQILYVLDGVDSVSSKERKMVYTTIIDNNVFHSLY